MLDLLPEIIILIQETSQLPTTPHFVEISICHSTKMWPFRKII